MNSSCACEYSGCDCGGSALASYSWAVAIAACDFSAALATALGAARCSTRYAEPQPLPTPSASALSFLVCCKQCGWQARPRPSASLAFSFARANCAPRSRFTARFGPPSNRSHPRRMTLSSNPWHGIAARGIPHSELTVSFLLKTRRIAESQAHVRVGHTVAFPHSAGFEAVNGKGNLKIVWLNNHQTAIVQN
jgi:hypothetical protein